MFDPTANSVRARTPLTLAILNEDIFNEENAHSEKKKETHTANVKLFKGLANVINNVVMRSLLQYQNRICSEIFKCHFRLMLKCYAQTDSIYEIFSNKVHFELNFFNFFFSSIELLFLILLFWLEQKIFSKKIRKTFHFFY